MAQNAAAEAERRPDPPSAVDVELESRPNLYDAHARNVGLLAALPLAEREVRDLVALFREPLRERAKPALAAADGVRVETVVD